MPGLQENKVLIDTYNSANLALATKIAAAKETLAKEKSSQYLLNYELSKITSIVNKTKQEISQMDGEHSRLVKANQELGPELKRIRNYLGLVNPMQMDRKAEWMQNLNNQLNTLDFNAEVRDEDPNYKMDSLTQFRYG